MTATITGLDAETLYDVRVRARSDEGNSAYVEITKETLPLPNVDPILQTITRLSVNENSTGVGTITAADDDPMDDIEFFEINGGADAAFFEIDRTTGALVFKAAPNYEDPKNSDTNNEYLVNIEVTSGWGGRGRSATEEFQVEVTDELEPPGAPHSLTATPTTTHTATTITLSWQAGENEGPALSGYQVQSKKDSEHDTEYEDVSPPPTGLTATITGLDAETLYDVRVRARSDEGNSAYVEITKETLPLPNVDPILQTITRLSVEENSTGVGTITAADDDPPDNIEFFEINGGADAALFEIDRTTGALVFKAAPNYEDPKDSDTNNEYLVDIQVTSGTGSRAKSVTEEFQVEVTDELEAPGVPQTVTATATVTTITLTWLAADNEGPALSGYQVQSKKDSEPDTEYADVTPPTTGLTATITGLDAETLYDVRVRARSDEGESDFVQITKETLPIPNEMPSFQITTRLSVEENTTSVDTITAQGSDPLNNNVSFEIDGGADAALFEIGQTTGALVFMDAPDYEDPKDFDTNNEYLVNISVTSGTGDQARSLTQSFTVVVTDATEAPGVPQTVTATATETTITLTWLAADNEGPALRGYQVQSKRDSEAEADYEDVTTTTDLTATLTGLDADTLYDVRVRARSDEGDSAYVEISQSTLEEPNADPELQTVTELTVEENTTSVGTITAQDGDSLDSIESFAKAGGDDAALFTLTVGGDLTFDSAPDYEDPADFDTDNEYEVDISVTSGTGGRARTATKSFTVVVTDATEAPGMPQTVTATATETTITLTWLAADNEGPALRGYQVQSKRDSEAEADYEDVTTTTDLTATLTGLDADTLYDVRVRARSDEGDSAYVEISQSTLEEPNADPELQTVTELTVEENTTSVGTITAQDGDSLDSIESFAKAGGDDAALFTLTVGGDLTFDSAPDYEDPADFDTDNEYEVDISVTSGTGGRARTATKSFTVVVTDATEAPGMPQTVTATATETTITLTWLAADNEGPALRGYQVQSKRDSEAEADYEDVTTTTDLTATLTGLDADTLYDVRVRARSDEGDSAYVEISQSTLEEPNADPELQTVTELTVEENTTSVGTITAQDDDSQDSIVSFAKAGGADAALFTLTVGGDLTFDSAPDYEDPADFDTNNEYEVDISVTSGTGDRVRTATQSFTVVVTDATEVPGVPQSLTATSTFATITLSWQAAENKGPALEGYQVQYHEGSPDPDTKTFLNAITTDRDVLTATVSSLDAATTYTLRVRAVSAEGESEYVQTDLATKGSAIDGAVAENPDCAPDSNTICQVVLDTLSTGGTHETDDAFDFHFFNAVSGFYRLVVEGGAVAGVSDEFSWLRLKVLDTESKEAFVRPAFDISTNAVDTTELIYDFAIDEAGKYYISMQQVISEGVYSLNLTRRTPPGEYLQIGTPISGSIANSDEKDIVSIIGGKGKTYSVRFEGSRAQGFTGNASVSLKLYGPEHTGYSLYNNVGDFEVILTKNVSISSDVDNTYEFDIPTTGGYWFVVEVSGESLVPVVDYTLTLAEETTDQ